MLTHGHLELVAQDYIQAALLQYFQGQRVHSLSGQPVPVQNKGFPDAQMEPLSQFGLSLKSIWLHLLCTLPSGICTHWWDLSSLGWKVSAFSAFPHRRGAPDPLMSSQPFAGLSILSLLHWGLRTTGVTSTAEQKGRIIPLSLPAAPLMQPKISVAICRSNKQ